jgi:diacylglycerol kinase (ATP)
MRHVFIINPKAGKHSSEQLIRTSVEQYFSENGGKYEIFVTNAPNHATEIAKAEAQKGESVRIYACGGDGTLSEVANGATGFKNAEIACIPTGSGNDFVKNFGKKQDFLDINALVNGKIIQVDIIKYGNKLACNVCSVGFDAEVALNMVRFKNLPLTTGSMAYKISIIYCMLSKIKSKFEITIDNAEKHNSNFLLCAVANGKWYGGGFMPAPIAKTDDGLLDFVLVNAVSRLKIIEVIGKYKSGEHLQLKDIVTYKQGKSIQIKSDKYFAVNIDGDCFYAKNIEFDIIKSGIMFVVPNK